MAEQAQGPHVQAARFLADIRFHRSFWLPPDPDLGRSAPIRVTFSDIGHQDGTVILFCGGLFSSRYTLAQADELAKQRKVRLICPDKPGIGGSEPVELDRKVKTWLGEQLLALDITSYGSFRLLDIVQALVQHLGVKHISLAGHSSGAIYVLNTVLYLRHLLQPDKPYVAIIAPWVHPSRSKVVSSSAGDVFPDWAIHRWYDATHLVSRTITPILGPSTARPGVKMRNNDAYTRAIDEKVLEYALAENVEGVSQEALFCLRRGREDLWGSWKDYDRYVIFLRDHEVEKCQGCKLTVEVFFAESDNSSGEGGARWFDDCWKGGRGEDWIKYSSSTVPGTTHETIVRPEFGVIGTIFSRITEM